MKSTTTLVTRTNSKDIFEQKYLENRDGINIADVSEAGTRPSSSSSLNTGLKHSDDFDERNSKLKSTLDFNPLSEEAEKYLMEAVRLPSVTSVMLPRKCYVNYHLSESDLSQSVNSMSESWSLDHDCDCHEDHGTRVARGQHDTIVENIVQEVDIKRKEYPRTKEALLKRRLEAKEKERENREQVVYNLEKQMMSLYNLKQHYKRNLRPEGCQTPVALPPIGGRDGWQAQLASQRDSLINKIKRKTMDEEKRKQNQLDRKLIIIQKLLKEQRSKHTQDEKPLLNHIEKRKERRVDEINCHGQDTFSHKFSASHLYEKPEGRESNITEHNEKVSTESALGFNDDMQEISNVEEEVKDVREKDKTVDQMKQSTKKDKRKKSSGSVRTVSQKSKKKKGKNSVKNEARAAISEDKHDLQQPASEIQDLLLWFENWRETHEEQIRILKEIEDRKIPEETEVVLNPNKVIFKDAQVGFVSNQQVTITNIGHSSLQCRVTATNDSHPLIQTELRGPSKAGPGGLWTLNLTMEAVEEVSDSSHHVQLLFCRSEALSKLSVEVEILTQRAEPTLSTTYIRFGQYEWWSAVKVKRYVQLRNKGGLPCHVTWRILGDEREQEDNEEEGYQDMHQGEEEEGKLTWDSLDTADESNGKSPPASMKNSVFLSVVGKMANKMVENAFENVFDVFRIELHQPLVLPAHSTVSIPATFLPSMSLYKGDVFATVRFKFDGGAMEHPVQDLLVCATVLDSPFSLDPALLDVGVCFTGGGGACQGRATVRSCATHACSVRARVPRRLAGCVAVAPTASVVQARSSVTLAVRLSLGWRFLEEPCPFLDRSTGLLSLPVLVDARAPGPRPPPPPLVLTVMAAVVPPCPLTINPSFIDLGQVSTLETVSAKIQLINHYQLPYSFAFIDMPQSIMIEPGGGCGTILAGESLDLRLLCSFRPEDLNVTCGMPGAQGQAGFTLKCFTTVSFASPIFKQPTHDIPSRISRLTSNRSSSTYSSAFTHSQSQGEGSGETTNIDPSQRELIKDNDSTSKHPSISSEFGDGDVLEHVLKYEEGHSISDHLSTNDEIENASTSVGNKDIKCHYYSQYIIRGETQDHLIQDFEDYDDYGTDDKVVLDEEDLLETSFHDKFSLKDPSSKDYLKLDNKEVADKKYADHEVAVEETESISNNMDGVSPIKSNAVMIPASIQRFVPLTVRALVLDPLVELSSQVILLPPTPCNSYTTAHLYIRSRNQNKCRVHDKHTKFKTYFEFKSSIKNLSIEPKDGCLGYKESLKISLIFNPTMSQQEIFGRAFEMKREEMKWDRIQQMLERYYKSKEKKQKRSKAGSVATKKSGTLKTKNNKGSTSIVETNKKKRSKGSVVSTKKTKKSSVKSRVKRKGSGPLPDVVVLPEEVVVTDDDMRKAEVWLLRYFEPRVIEATLTCLLRTEMGDGNSRMEQLQCRVVCPLEAPALALLSSCSLQFGPTAIGSATIKSFDVTNVSFWDAPVHLSTLNPLGPFRCPIGLEISKRIRGVGLELPPEHTLSIPIVFQPIEPKEVSEQMEVWSGGTALMLKACGRGVAPSYTVFPDRDVFTITASTGKKAEFTISVSNTCEAPLHFKLKLEFLKEGFTLPENKEESPPLSPASAKNKESPKKKKNKKISRELISITPELMYCIENDYVDLTTPEPIFKVLDDNEEISISVGETKQLTVRFNPPQNIRSSRGKKGDEKSNKSERKKSKDRGSVIKGKQVKSLSTSEVGKKKSTKAAKKGSKTDKEMSVKSDKENAKGSKKYIAAKFNLLFAGVIKSKEWIFLGSLKK